MTYICIFFCSWFIYHALIIDATLIFTIFIKRTVSSSWLVNKFRFFIFWFVIYLIFFTNLCFILKWSSFSRVNVIKFITFPTCFCTLLAKIMATRTFTILNTLFFLRLLLYFDSLFCFLSFRYLSLKNRIIHILKTCY